MDTGRKVLMESGERWSALALAVAMTILLFAAINAGFSVPVFGPAPAGLAL
jgi:hypothetical protein